MKRRARTRLLAFALLAACAGPVQAQEEDEELPDARVNGYTMPTGKVGSVELAPKDARGNATVWFIMAGLGVIGLGGMFKNAKRTHLD